MDRRNHFRLNQGCNPDTCTNCSCEGCKNNKLGQGSFETGPTGGLEIHSPAPEGDTTLDDRFGDMTFEPGPGHPSDLYIPGATEEVGVKKGMSLIQSLLVTGAMLGVFKFILDNRGKKLKLGRCK